MKTFKNKINKNRFELTALLLALLVIVLINIVAATASPVSADNASSVPSLFYNETAFMFDSMFPLQMIDGVYYIPIDLLKLLNNISVGPDKFTDDFFIQYKKNWLSFKISADKVWGNKFNDYMVCKVLFLNWTTYVPAQFVADNLGLEIEVNTLYNSLRIKQEGSKKTFDELLDKYIIKPQPTTPPPTEPPSPPPTSPPETNVPSNETATLPPVTVEPISDEPATGGNNITITRPPTEPTTTAEPTTAENTREIENYLMFYDSFVPDENNEIDDSDKISSDRSGRVDRITEVLKILDKNNLKAVFFLSADEITENPDILRRIYASGHEPGIKFTAGTPNSDIEDLTSELETANNLIYSAIKHKTKFCVFSESFDASEEIIENTGFDENKLIERGYYLCKKSVDIIDLNGLSSTDEMIDYLKQKTLNVFMFDLSGGYKNYLELSARAAEVKFYINFSYINNANIDKIKKQIK